MIHLDEMMNNGIKNISYKYIRSYQILIVNIEPMKREMGVPLLVSIPMSC